MKKLQFQEIEATSGYFKIWLGVVLAIFMLGIGAGYYMEHNGHYVTGMTNQIVWGMPHVFAVFLIVAASGALNVASIASVFSKTPYKPMARFSALLAIGLLVGGLYILILDLGRPIIEVFKIIVDPRNLNPVSVFAWNIYLYPVFIGVAIIYLWFMLEPKMQRYSTIAGWMAFISRLLLTTGTGLIFGFLVARASYDMAILAPMFIIMSFSFGMACFLIGLATICHLNNIPLGTEILRRMKNLFATFIAAVLYMVATFFVVKLYYAQTSGFAKFILMEGGIFTSVFWVGQIIIGGLIPLIILFHPVWSKKIASIVCASTLVVFGALCQIYVIIIGGQAFPLQIFPGKKVSSDFFDGAINAYTAQPPEYLLGLSGVALGLIIVSMGLKLFRIMPVSLADKDIDPVYKAAVSKT